MKYALRGKFDGGIIAEFLPPMRPTKRQRVIILCDGMPTVPAKGALLRFLSQKGYWVFHPRYRGSWESEGVFLREPPSVDIGLVIDHLARKEFQDAWNEDFFRILDLSGIVLIGSSFGGAAALLMSQHQLVRRVVAFSSLVDWTARSEAESIPFLAQFVDEGFGQAYRMDKNAWDRLAGGAFFNPIREVNSIDGSKVLIIHARDDETILPKPVEQFAKLTKSKLVMLKRGGHMGLNTVMRSSHWRRIQKFIA